MKTTKLRLSEAELKEARVWLADCTWRNMEPEDFDDLPADVIEQGIERWVDGGIAEFRRMCA